MAHFIDFTDLWFLYDSSDQFVFRELTLRLHAAWTAVVGPNGAGKTTLLRLAAGEIAPERGTVRAPGPIVYCAQRTDDPPPELPSFLSSNDKRAHTLRGQLRIEWDFADRWETLSHGERKRAQIGVALWGNPATLLLDEPTNHVDAEGRQLLLGALSRHRGVGLLVSHDRELMEELCGDTLFVDAPEVDLRSGPDGPASADRTRENEEVAGRLAKERRELSRLEREAARRRQHAEKLTRGLSKKGINPKDRSAKEAIDRARVTGADKKAMGRALQLDGRRRQSEERIAALDARRERRLGIRQSGARSQRNALFVAPAGSIPLPDGREIAHPELRIEPADRIGVTGPNGAGKTTLLCALIARLELPEGRLLSLPQEITAAEGATVADRVRMLPNDRRGEVMSVVSRLGSDPRRLLATTSPSPGELRKLLLALGMASEPWLLMMDEPTNHLDLPSVECLEAALAEFPGALLLVSHDHEFLARTTETAWRLDQTEEGSELLHGN